MIDERTKKRFWSKVDKGDGNPYKCWEWMAAKNGKGYGRFYLSGKTITAQRAAFMIDGGRIPNGMMVCHKCDNPGCVNPSHLFCGTASDNTQDMMSKGRDRHGKPRNGKDNHNTKLTKEQVILARKIYDNGERSYKKIRKQIKANVHISAIGHAIHKRSWAWLKG